MVSHCPDKIVTEIVGWSYAAKCSQKQRRRIHEPKTNAVLARVALRAERLTRQAISKVVYLVSSDRPIVSNDKSVGMYPLARLRSIRKGSCTGRRVILFIQPGKKPLPIVYVPVEPGDMGRFLDRCRRVKSKASDVHAIAPAIYKT